MSDDTNDLKVLDLEKEFRKTVIEELKNIRISQDSLEECVDTLDKRVELHIQKTEYELASLNKMDQKQNELLAEHIAGVEGNRESIRALRVLAESHDNKDEARFAELEKTISNPGKLLGKQLLRISMAMAGGAVVILTLLKLIKELNLLDLI